MSTIYFHSYFSSIKNEDRMASFKVNSGYVWAIFDGHAGSEAAEACKDNVKKFFNQIIPAYPIKGNYSALFQLLFNRLHDECKKHPQSGTTATLLFVENESKRFHVAAVGDSPLYRCAQNAAFHCFKIPTWTDPEIEKNACTAWERFQISNEIKNNSLPLMDYWKIADKLRTSRRFLPVFYKSPSYGKMRECTLDDLKSVNPALAKACEGVSRIVMPTSLGDYTVAQYGAPTQKIVYNSFLLPENESLVLCSDGIYPLETQLFPPPLNPAPTEAENYLTNLVDRSVERIKDDASAFFIYWGKNQ